MKTISELRNLTIKELNDELLSLRDEQFKLRMQRANGSTNFKSHAVTQVRKAVARVKTLMTEKVG